MSLMDTMNATTPLIRFIKVLLITYFGVTGTVLLAFWLADKFTVLDVGSALLFTGTGIFIVCIYANMNYAHRGSPLPVSPQIRYDEKFKSMRQFRRPIQDFIWAIAIGSLLVAASGYFLARL